MIGFLIFPLKKCLIVLLLQEISEEKVKVFDTLILEKCVWIGQIQEISDKWFTLEIFPESVLIGLLQDIWAGSHTSSFTLGIV